MNRAIKYIIISTILCVIQSSFSSCSNLKKKSINNEDLKAKKELQGIWVDDDTESPIMRIKGDSIYYADSQTQPVYFKVITDTLFTYGSSTAAYKILKRELHILSLHSSTGEQLNLHKSEDPNDIGAFTHQSMPIPVYNTQVKRDSVVMYNNTRYRAYTYINPSRTKVVCSSISEDGFQVDNVYYDNVMHICVYEGAKMIYGSDITKKQFKSLVQSDFIDDAILSDMNFTKIDEKGFHYRAVLQQPESYISSIIDMVIDFNGKMSMTIASK
jgi:hypothetical protein